jgi:alkanesulfonate monooxygenase SsuD/methylene tetrahydromethanopterin reductase-like flavin-dependent oxidoreductase (luciferase family)
VLGVGTGESLNEVPSSGIAWPGAKERRDRLREAIRLINKLWTEDRVTFEGQFYRTESATIYDKPQDPKDKVPIWVAASGPACGRDGRADRRRLYLHQRQEPAAVHRPDRQGRRGPRPSGRSEDSVER